MGHTLKIDGELAEIRWGYLVAATVRQFTIERLDEKLILMGTVSQSDQMRLSQPSLTAIIPRLGWRWPVVSLQTAGDSLTAVLGPHEG